MEAFRNNQDLVPRDVSGLTETLLFDEFEDLFDKSRRTDMDSQVLRRKLENLVRKNDNLHFVKEMRSYIDDEEDFVFPLFIRICTLFVKAHDDCIALNDVDDIYDEDSILWRLQKNSLSRGNHRFFINKFIENTNDNGFVNREGFKITDEAKNKLFSGLNLPSVKDKVLRNGMISYKDIKPKSLVYNRRRSYKWKN